MLSKTRHLNLLRGCESLCLNLMNFNEFENVRSCGEDRLCVTRSIIILRLLGRRAVPYCKLTLLDWSTNSLLLKIR